MAHPDRLSPLFAHTLVEYGSYSLVGMMFFAWSGSSNGHETKGLKVKSVYRLVLCCLLLVNWPAFAGTHEDTAAIGDYIARQARHERGEEYREGRKVLTGDVNHDGINEMVALYTIEGQHGTNLHIQYLEVFVRKDGKLVPFTGAEVGGKGSRSVELVSIEGNAIRLEAFDYGPQDASCCPSQKGRTSYVLSGGRLKEQRTRK